MTCPFEESRCGPGPQVLIPNDGTQKTVQSRGYDQEDICYYWLEAMPRAETGDFMYV